jgi:hypothetical protein
MANVFVLVGSPKIYGVFINKKLAEEYKVQAEKLCSHVHIIEIPLNTYSRTWVI